MRFVVLIVAGLFGGCKSKWERNKDEIKRNPDTLKLCEFAKKEGVTSPSEFRRAIRAAGVLVDDMDFYKMLFEACTEMGKL
jgi:hypothetical protein